MILYILSSLQIFFSQNRTKILPGTCKDNTILKGVSQDSTRYTVDNTDYSETIIEPNKPGHLVLAGSFCVDETGSYSFDTYHLRWGGFSFDFVYQGDKYQRDPACWVGATQTVTKRTVTLYKNKCYQYYQYCSFICPRGPYGKIYVSKNGGEYTTIKRGQSKGCEITDCLPDYYGPNCQSYNDLYCGENPRSDGINGGDSCVCINGKAPPFCVDMNEIPVGHKKPLINVTKEASYKIYENHLLNDIIFEPYSEIDVNGKIEFPQNGEYEIRLSSAAPTVLQIGNKILGESNMKGKYYCDNLKFGTSSAKYVVSIPKTFFNRGIQTYKLKFFTGCAMNQNFETSLEWKFYRLYANLSTTPFETIPSRYLTE